MLFLNFNKNSSAVETNGKSRVFSIVNFSLSEVNIFNLKLIYLLS